MKWLIPWIRNLFTGSPPRMLGAKPSRRDWRTLRIANYLTIAKEWPPVPSTRTWSKAVTVPWGMLANDTLGDCTVAGICHFFMVAAANNGRQIQFDPAVISKIYLSLTGGQDTGLQLLDVLKYTFNTGIPDTTGTIHKLGAYAQVNLLDLQEVMAVINLFGPMYSGVALPNTCKNQVVWDVTDPSLAGDAAPDSWGGHCLAPGTRILTEDLRWVPIEKLEVGDSLIGFDEFSGDDGARRKYRRSIVQSSDILQLPCYLLEFEDGTKITASSDHLWLVESDGCGAWLPTERMRPLGPGASYGTKVLKPLESWDEDNSRDAGYLAGAFDGEGWLSTGGSSRGIHKLGLSQRDNPMFAHIKMALEERGFSYRQSTYFSGFKPGNSVEQLALSGRNDILRFLGSVRPHRLMPKFSADKIGCLHCKRLALVKITPVGEQVVVALGTSTRTYLAEGLASHNCVPIADYADFGKGCITWGELMEMTKAFFAAYFFEGWALFTEDWIENGIAPNGFNKADLVADMQTVTGPPQAEQYGN